MSAFSLTSPAAEDSFNKDDKVTWVQSLCRRPDGVLLAVMFTFTATVRNRDRAAIWTLLAASVQSARRLFEEMVPARVPPTYTASVVLLGLSAP